MTDPLIHPDSPDWFRRSLAVPYSDHHVHVNGARVHYSAWGQRRRRGLILVHGAGAHAHWWTHIAAQLSGDMRVVAVDLTGHGDSEHRDQYNLGQWADEVGAVAANAGIEDPPVVLGHSMGGFVSIVTAARHPRSLRGVIICESPVTRPDGEVQASPKKDPINSPRIYRSIDEAVSRFRAEPPQDGSLNFVIDHVARRAMRRIEDADGPGWVWKFDPGLFSRFRGGMRNTAMQNLSQVGCQFAVVRSQFGLGPPDIAAGVGQALGRVVPVVELPLAGHHPMLDQPLVLLGAIRTLIADWNH